MARNVLSTGFVFVLCSYYVRTMSIVPILYKGGPHGAWDEQGTNEFASSFIRTMLIYFRAVFVPWHFVPDSYPVRDTTTVTPIQWAVLLLHMG